MGHAEGKSMLYLEARCLMAIKGAGSQGVQNGSISCIALPESLPGGVRGVLAENLIAAMLDLELASGNDAMASHSEIRKSAKLMLQFLPGTDFIFSGYSSMPREDNLFGGGNFDAEDLDDYNVLQRDMQVDGGLRPVREAEVMHARRRASRGDPGCFRRARPAGYHRRRGRGGRHGAQQRRHARARRGGRPHGCRGVSPQRPERTGSDPGPCPSRVSGHRRKDSGGPETARLRRLSADCGGRAAGGPCAQRDQRPERLLGPRHRLPPRGPAGRRDRGFPAGARPPHRRPPGTDRAAPRGDRGRSSPATIRARS